ncbi:MAG: hypothetical protein ABW092_11350 [Candidatus Thiodiazotropha sp.]
MPRSILLSLLSLFMAVESPAGELELDWLQEIPPPLHSSLAITLGVDDADGWSRQLDLSLAAPLDTRFDLSMGESRVESDEAQLETDFHGLSFTTNPLAEMSLSLGYEDWGDDDALTIETLWFGLNFNLGNFSLALMPQQRDIRLQVLQWFQRQVPYVDLQSRDIGLSLTYYAADDWVFNAAYFSYDYSKDVSQLGDDYRVIFIFPLNALDLASGLDEYRYSLAVGRLMDEINIDLDWTRSRSAVDNNTASVISLSADLPLNDQISLNLIGGIQEVDYSDDQILFANLGLTLFW